MQGEDHNQWFAADQKPDGFYGPVRCGIADRHLRRDPGHGVAPEDFGTKLQERAPEHSLSVGVTATCGDTLPDTDR